MSTDVDVALTALADPVRRHVVDLLGRSPRPAGALAREIQVSPPALSRHLRVLRRAGLVEARAVDSDARLRIYELRPDQFAALRAWLDQVEAFWSDQLGAFAEHVSNTVTTTEGSPDVPPNDR